MVVGVKGSVERFAARPTPLQVNTDTAPVFAAGSFLASCLLAASKADLVEHKGIYYIGVIYRDHIGRTFISSCRRVYGHEPVLCKAVVEVPWPHASSSVSLRMGDTLGCGSVKRAAEYHDWIDWKNISFAAQGLCSQHDASLGLNSQRLFVHLW